MYNLNTHEAFKDLKETHFFDKILMEDFFNTKNYTFITFNDLIPKDAKELAEDLVKYQSPYRGKIYTNLTELTAKIEGDVFELFVMFFLQYFRGPDIFISSGTYNQIADSEDVGMDFYGICESNKSERIFGQIKYRNDNIPNIEPPFTRTVCNKLIGAAVVNNQFNTEHDKVVLVTNLSASLALHFKLKNDIGWVNDLNPDVMHDYIKVIDKNTFNNQIGFNYKTFWEDFLKEFTE